MKNHWAMEFYHLAKSKGINCRIGRMINGWVETLHLGEKNCFTKSVTYNLSRKQLFQGVDPPKLNESGDFVLICGGTKDKLSDIFIFPWGVFFKTIEEGEPVNTYKQPREYFQYKFYLRDRDNSWLMTVQGRTLPVLDVSSWHYSVAGALEFFSSMKQH